VADVNIQQTPQPVREGSSGAVIWAIIAMVLLGVLAWFIFGGNMTTERGGDVDININTPAAPASPAPDAGKTPPPSGGKGG
jgi:hypothetical protein